MYKKFKNPKLIITCGLMGTGKSTIAKEFAKIKGILIISSDFVRKELAGISSSQHKYEDFDKGIYSQSFSKKTYQSLNTRAREILIGGNSVILDACFSKKWQREKAYEVAKEVDANFLCIEFVCSDKEIKKRLTKRLKSKEGVSDGRWAIFPEQKASFENILEFSDEEHFIVDTSYPIDECVESIIKKVENFS